MSDCDRIEAAVKGLSEESKLADANALVGILQELNGSHIVGSKLMKEAPAVAKELEAAHKYTKDMSNNLSMPGVEALVQQQRGIANTLVLTEGSRSEVLRLDSDNPVPTPVMSNTTYRCGDKSVTAWSSFVDGKPVLSGITLPDLSISLDRDGKPRKIEAP